MKRRFEICCVIFSVVSIFGFLAERSPEKFLVNGDGVFLSILISLIGKKWSSVHHYSLCAVVLIRGAYSIAQI